MENKHEKEIISPMFDGKANDYTENESDDEDVEPCWEHNNVFCHLCDFEGDRQNDSVTHMKGKHEKEMITPLFDGKATNDTEAKKTPKYPSREWVVKKAAADVKNCEMIEDFYVVQFDGKATNDTVREETY